MEPHSRAAKSRFSEYAKIKETVNLWKLSLQKRLVNSILFEFIKSFIYNGYRNQGIREEEEDFFMHTSARILEDGKV